jgi:hypothetical protein
LEQVTAASWALTDSHCHCEERSDEAIHLSSLVFQKKMDCFTSFAMTGAGTQLVKVFVDRYKMNRERFILMSSHSNTNRLGV